MASGQSCILRCGECGGIVFQEDMRFISHIEKWMCEQCANQLYECVLDSRAGKLLLKGKFFVVVAVDEPYFATVYDLIRRHEKAKSRWTDEDEQIYQQGLAEWRTLQAD